MQKQKTKVIIKYWEQCWQEFLPGQKCPGNYQFPNGQARQSSGIEKLSETDAPGETIR